ncbi:MAG: DUF1189 domain-containing protein [Acholeplasmataceae bacterium]|nr:MAG: DUF1189 domain-containing protein [Acholeplasmataceae bacterium]
MFLVRYFRYSFEYAKLFTRLDEAFGKVLIYFFILVMISAFPLNYLIVREQGWRLDFITESFRVETPDWVLPDSCQIRASKLVCDTDEAFVYTHRGLTYIFNYQEDDVDASQHQVLLKEDIIIYTNGHDATMFGVGYTGFDDVVDFTSINFMTGQDRADAFIALGEGIEATFGPYIVIYTVLVNTIVSLLTNTLFVLLLAIVMQLFRFGYSTFMTFTQSIKLVIFIMTLPAVASFFIGFFSPAFAPVIFQLGMGLITMLVMLIYGRKTYA